MIKKCEWCGKSFEAGGNTKYCSDDCREEKKKDYMRKYNNDMYKLLKPPADDHRVCVCCGKEFAVNVKSHRSTCSDECANIRRSIALGTPAIVQQDRYFMPKKRKNKAIVNIAVEARKEGLSYGEYVAKYNL